MPNVVQRFSVKIDGDVDLGDFITCEGLSSEYEVLDWAEGGKNGYVHHLLGRVKHTNIKLTRGLDEKSIKVAAWVSGYEQKRVRHTGRIIAYATDDHALCTWGLSGIAPVKWVGPSFAADGTGIAKETLELTHQGFKMTLGGG